MPFVQSDFAAKIVSPRSAASTIRAAIAASFIASLSPCANAAHHRQTAQDAAQTTAQNTVQSTPQTSADNAIKVTLAADGAAREIVSDAATVGDLLAAQNIHLGPLDRCSFSLTTALKPGMQLTVARIHSAVVVERAALPFAVKQTYTSSMPSGCKSIKLAGVNGERVVRYRCTYVDDKITCRTKLDESITHSTTQIETVGTRGMTLASRGFFGGRRIVEMVATGYGPGGNGRWGMRTASGLRPGFGVVAVDPHFIPLGTRLYIERYGYAVAGDTGGAIKGNRIDLGRNTNEEASAEGRKTVRVLILN